MCRATSSARQLAAGAGVALALQAGHTHAAEESSANASTEVALPRLTLSPTLGVTWRRSSESHANYAPSLTFGGYSLIPLTESFAVRASVEMERHAVRLQSGSLGTAPGTELAQPDLEGVRLGCTLRYSRWVAPRLQFWAESGIAWLRFQADPLEGGAAQPFVLARRSGVLLEVPVSVGSSVLLVRRHLMASVRLTRGISLQQTGRLFAIDNQELQIVRQDSGEIAYISGLPVFKSPLALSFAVDVLF